MIGVKGAAVMAAALSLASGAVAQEYRVEFLHPMDARWVWSTGRGISGGQMVGELHPLPYGGRGHAAVWNGDRNSWVDLHPKGAVNSQAYGVGGGIQVGRVQSGNGVYAAMWRGTAESLVNLGAPGFDIAEAYATDGEYQVGIAGTIQGTQAYVWQGSAESARNITPPGARNAGARDVHNGIAVGSASYPDRSSHAILWDLRSDEYYDLHPSGVDLSALNGVFGSQQVGFVLDPATNYQRAGVWQGSAESFTNLHPIGSMYQRTWAHATNGNVQVGEGWVPMHGRTDFHALAWMGTAESMIDLNAFLPDGFRSAAAHDIDQFGNIIGWADLDSGPTYAVVWRPVPEPGTLGAAGVGIALLVWRKAKREGRIKP